MSSVETGTLWLGDAGFNARMRELLCDPIEHRRRFHAEWMPIRRMIGVYGHYEAMKADVVAAFCEANLLTHATVSVRYGFSGAFEEDVRRVLETHAREDLSVLIIDHADVLALEPEDAATQRFALKLEKLAEEEHFFIVACFDRVLTDFSETYVRHFRLQFPTLAYLAPPPSTWIARYLRAQFEGYLTRAGTAELELKLTDDEFTVVAQHCVGASIGHLRQWVRDVFYEAYRSRSMDGPLTGAFAITKDFLCSSPLMRGGNQGLRIMAQDVRRDESKFSVAVGQGPTGSDADSLIKPPPNYMDKLDASVKKKRRAKKRSRLVENEGGNAEDEEILFRDTEGPDDGPEPMDEAEGASAAPVPEDIEEGKTMVAN